MCFESYHIVDTRLIKLTEVKIDHLASQKRKKYLGLMSQNFGTTISLLFLGGTSSLEGFESETSRPEGSTVSSSRLRLVTTEEDSTHADETTIGEPGFRSGPALDVSNVSGEARAPGGNKGGDGEEGHGEEAGSGAPL